MVMKHPVKEEIVTSPSASLIAHVGLRIGADVSESKHKGLLCEYGALLGN